MMGDATEAKGAMCKEVARAIAGTLEWDNERDALLTLVEYVLSLEEVLAAGPPEDTGDAQKLGLQYRLLFAAESARKLWFADQNFGDVEA